MPKPKMYRITSEDRVYLGGRDQVNNLPDPYKALFLKALKQASEGATPTPFSVPPKTLTDAGFTTEEEFLSQQEKPESEEEAEVEEMNGGGIKPTLKKTRPHDKSFVDILADKIVERVLERLLK